MEEKNLLCGFPPFVIDNSLAKKHGICCFYVGDGRELQVMRTTAIKKILTEQKNTDSFVVMCDDDDKEKSLSSSYAQIIPSLFIHTRGLDSEILNKIIDQVFQAKQITKASVVIDADCEPASRWRRKFHMHSIIVILLHPTYQKQICYKTLTTYFL